MNVWRLHWDSAAGRFLGPADARDADFVLYFAQRHLAENPALFDSLRALCADALILGCSTGTTISGAVVDDFSATAVAVRLKHARVALAATALDVAHSHEAGQRIGAQLQGEQLAGVLVLSDGLNVNGAALVAGMQDVLGGDVPIGGGLAGDGALFEMTIVSANGRPQRGIAAALGFYGADIRFDMGAAHGWDFFGPTRRITRSSGVVLHELDGAPALRLYEKYLGEEADALPASALLYPLLITNPQDPNDQVVRTVLGVDRESGAMTFAGDMPQGWSARLMRGDFDNLTQGAADAATFAAGGNPADGGLALLVSCVGRRLLMGQHTASEVEAVLGALPEGYLQTGFYSYGEIATRGAAGLCGLHNQTMTVMTIREVA